MSLYIETRIRGDLDEVWQKTQSPDLHEQWDLRFSSIEYLPRASESDPQRFRYSTRLGFGLTVKGEGESIASRVDDGRCTSSLRFWSDDPKSLIREGAGYWQYVSTKEGIRFTTGYDYQTRFGWFGKQFDRFVFRPLMGWATAWSFDRLRLWIEKGIDPAASMRASAIHALCRIIVALVWLYQGLVPKLIARHADEVALMAEAGIPSSSLPWAMAIIGLGEVLFAAMVLGFYRQRWPLVLTVWLMVVAIADVTMKSPRFLVAAFNPISMNVLLATLAIIGLVAMHDLPTATHCLRKKPEVPR